jgi:tetratricopeptide (TPR) repeat protein
MAAQPAKPVVVQKSEKVNNALRLIAAKDDLGFRIYVQKIYRETIRRGEWYQIKGIINASSDRVGLDLIPFWNSRNPGDFHEVDILLGKSDDLVLSGRFEEAFGYAQKAAQKLKTEAPSRKEARAMLPYAYHSMGRALFGAKRFDDAVTVYQWLNTTYPDFRQVLFEKMWSAFKAGRVEIALGAIASLRSAYFPKYLPVEAYLIQAYLLRRLCREADLAQVGRELDQYERFLINAKVNDWVENDPSSKILWRLSKPSPPQNEILSLVPRAERDAEKAKIADALNRRFEKIRPILLKNLRTIRAFEHLTTLTDTHALLKPVQSMKDRDELLKMNLEVWPADAKEDWLDEVGKHILIGESLCEKTGSK